MDLVRALLRNRRLSVVMLTLVLAIKALVPGGYMLADAGKVLTVTICADASGGELTRQIVLPSHGKAAGHAKAEGTCPFAAHAAAGLAGADLPLLALALGFILALGFLPVRSRRAAPTLHLRPPLRGPPART